MKDLEFAGLIAGIIAFVFIGQMLYQAFKIYMNSGKYPLKTIKREEFLDEESSEEFFQRILDSQEESAKIWEEAIIKMNNKEHRFNKLKSKKPKWIHQ